MWRILIRSAPVVGSIFGHSWDWEMSNCPLTEVLILLLNIYNGAYSDKTPLCVHSYKSTLFLSHLIIGIGLPLAPRLQWMSEALYFCCLLIHSFHHCHMVSFEPVEQPIKAKQTKRKISKTALILQGKKCLRQIIHRLSILPDFHNAGYIHEPQDSAAQLFHFYDARTKQK